MEVREGMETEKYQLPPGSGRSVEPEETPRAKNAFDYVRDFVYEPQALNVAEALVKTNSYQVDMERPQHGWFTWRSGIKAPCYCDCRHLNCHPSERALVSTSLCEAVRHSFSSAELVVGMATAGIPWARTVADKLSLPLAYVRSSAKPHGVGGLVECSPRCSTKAILVDDLVASGRSLQQAITVLERESNIRVIGVCSIVNWGFRSMRESLQHVQFLALTSFPHILTFALAEGKIGEQDFLELMSFYQNPATHKWSRIAAGAVKGAL